MTEKVFKKICVLAVLCLVCSAIPASAAKKAVQNTLTADDIRYNVNTGDARAIGNVVLTRGASTIKGSEAEGNTSSEVLTVLGGVVGDFPEEQVTLKSSRATWTGDKTKKTDGKVEAFGNVLITRGADDRLNADYVEWELGTENYRAKGNVDGIMSGKILKADVASRIGEKFWAREVRRYEDTVQKFVLSAKSMEGRLTKDGESGQDVLDEMTADKDVVFDYEDNEGLTTRVTGDTAVYSKARGTIVVSGHSKAVRSDGKTVEADTMVVHEDTRLVEAKGNSKIVFIIEEDESEEAEEETKPAKRERKERRELTSAAAGDSSTSPIMISRPVEKNDISDEDKSWVEQ